MIKTSTATLTWFITITIVTTLLLGSINLGYMWFVVIGLSFFLGFQPNKELPITDQMNQQLAMWIEKYNNSSYHEKQLYLFYIVHQAIKTDQIDAAHNLLNHIIDFDPYNETAKNLLVSIWGNTLVVSKYNLKNIS